VECYLKTSCLLTYQAGRRYYQAVLHAVLQAYTNWEVARETRNTTRLLGHVIQPGWQVLDLGCGTAHATAALANFAGGPIFGADIADLRRATVERFCLYDGLRLPFGGKSFDLVILAFVLHHVSNREKLLLLREARRVTRGLVAVIEDTPRHALDAWMGQRHAERYRRRIGSNQDYGFLHQLGWHSLLQQERFTILESRPLGRLARGFSQPWPRHFFLLGAQP
jgi:SAM-dependent methyltransferase